MTKDEFPPLQYTVEKLPDGTLSVILDNSRIEKGTWVEFKDNIPRLKEGTKGITISEERVEMSNDHFEGISIFHVSWLTPFPLELNCDRSMVKPTIPPNHHEILNILLLRSLNVQPFISEQELLDIGYVDFGINIWDNFNIPDDKDPKDVFRDMEMDST